jgi:hypothetical protein
VVTVTLYAALARGGPRRERRHRHVRTSTAASGHAKRSATMPTTEKLVGRRCAVSIPCGGVFAARVLRHYAEHCGFPITREYVDQASGDVRKGNFDSFLTRDNFVSHHPSIFLHSGK